MLASVKAALVALAESRQEQPQTYDQLDAQVVTVLACLYADYTARITGGHAMPIVFIQEPDAGAIAGRLAEIGDPTVAVIHGQVPGRGQHIFVAHVTKSFNRWYVDVYETLTEHMDSATSAVVEKLKDLFPDRVEVRHGPQGRRPQDAFFEYDKYAALDWYAPVADYCGAVSACTAAWLAMDLHETEEAWSRLKYPILEMYRLTELLTQLARKLP